MQLAKVVIASALVLAACAEGLPEGKSYVLKGSSDVNFLKLLSAILMFAVQLTNCCMLSMCNMLSTSLLLAVMFDVLLVFFNPMFLLYCTL